jgi:transcriptional regulator with XRE-family HTH domain
MLMNRVIGNNIRKTRISLNLTTQTLAQKLGISRSYLTLIETGVRPISERLINPFAGTLKISKNTLKEWYLEQSMNRLIDRKSWQIIKQVLCLSPVQKSRLLTILKRI